MSRFSDFQSPFVSVTVVRHIKFLSLKEDRVLVGKETLYVLKPLGFVKVKYTERNEVTSPNIEVTLNLSWSLSSVGTEHGLEFSSRVKK